MDLTYNTTKLIDGLKELLKNEFKSKIDINSGILIETNRLFVKDIAEFLKKDNNWRLNGIYAINRGTFFELVYLYSLDDLQENLNLYIKTQIDKKINTISSISQEFASAKAYEQRILNLYGIIFVSTDQEFDRTIFCNPISIMPPRLEQNPLTRGIFEPVHQDNQYFEFEIKEGIIKYISLKDGWLHKKNSTLNPDSTLNDAFNLLEDIDPYTSAHYKTGICLLLEQLLNLKVENKSQYIRTLFLELERIDNHLIWFANLFNVIGFMKPYYAIFMLHKKFEELKKLLSNNIFFKDTVFLGGSIDIADNISFLAKKYLKDIFNEAFDFIYSYIYDKPTINKLKNTGYIESQKALNLGITGPALRGCGIPYDIRYTSPYLIYTKGELSQLWKVVAFEGNDNYARSQVRLWEIKQSYLICKNILDNLSVYGRSLKITDFKDKNITLPPSQNAIIRLESPQGQIIFSLTTDKTIKPNTIGHIIIIPPALPNFYALNSEILQNKYLAEVPLTIHTMDLSFQALDL